MKEVRRTITVSADGKRFIRFQKYLEEAFRQLEPEIRRWMEQEKQEKYGD